MNVGIHPSAKTLNKQLLSLQDGEVNGDVDSEDDDEDEEDDEDDGQ